MLELTFKQICELIKKDGKQDPTLIDGVDKLLGLALVCSPLAVGPALVAALPTLAVKNEIIRLSKDVFERLTNKDDEDYLGRQERMQMAYGLVVFTAFFDALDSQLPRSLRERVGSLDPHKAFLAKDAARKLKKSERLVVPISSDAPLASALFAFPHPTEVLANQIERHRDLWVQMSHGFSDFVQRLAFWNETDEKEQAQIQTIIQKIPEQVPRVFESQYFELARTFEEFAVWSNLHEHTRTKQLLRGLSEYVKEHIRLSNAGEKAIDIGFSKLHGLVLDIPETLKISRADELVESLSKHYKARVEDPIIEDKDEPEPTKATLVFPRICDAFIPQAFRVLRQSGKGRQLEDEETWSDLPRRNDLGAFLVSYLTSPYSTEAPLLILGHPGSGKSLLTTVLASQLMSKQFTAIRVPLREVNAESGIVSQVEEAIRRITNISIDSWAKLSVGFKNSPPLVILDGYDELLQASGKVFASYLKDVQHFQKNEAEQGRPVRVIVTSRVTLIDKATVPSGATIVRLLEFDESQRERWISIWNKTNVNYFTKAKVDEFGLPDKKEAGAEKILALAEQPLLLLMLALYDSQDNQLRKSKGLDRTKLYDSLLRRFVTRERGKEKGFDDAKPVEKKKALDVEMQRLGVAALGMYNRRKVHILTPELDDDLRFFSLEKSVNVIDGKPLSQADLLLGSFFFVHKSKAQHAAGAPETHEETAAFEFLHNTFGEFLTADFSLRRALAEVEALQAFQKSEALREDLEKRLNDADGFKREWFASLVYTPLFTRPVVMEMMREWITHILKERNLSREEFVATLDMMVLNQLRRLLNKREMPSIICKETAQEGYRALFGDHPLLGHIAIYSINLILLRVLISEKPLVFDETQIDSHEDGTRPWDRLTHIWRSWFSLDNLNGITAVMVAQRNDVQVTVRAKEKFQVAESQNRLATCFNVGISLADNISSGLTGLIVFDPFGDNQLTIEEISERLASEKLELQLDVSVKRLLDLERRLDDQTVHDYFHELRRAIDFSVPRDRFEELERIALSVLRAIRHIRANQPYRPFSRESEAIRHYFNPDIAAEISSRHPQAGHLLWEVAKELDDPEWTHRFVRGVMEHGFRRYHPSELSERSPELWLSWLKLIREFVDGYYLDAYRDKFLHEIFERMMDPHSIARLTRLNPWVALKWFQLARKIAGGRFFSDVGHEIFARAFQSWELLEMSENPEFILGWLQLGLEAGADRFLRNLDPKLIDRVVNPDFIAEVIRHDPQVALIWIRVARALRGEQFQLREGFRVFDEIFHGRHGFGFTDLKRETALAWIKVARELRADGVGDVGRVFFERGVQPGRLVELSERSPEVALMWLQLLVELGGSQFLEVQGEKLFRHAFNPLVLDRLLRKEPTAFAFALRLARITQTRRGIEVILDCLIPSASAIENTEVLKTLPISALDDVKWLVEETNNSALRSAYRRLRNETFGVL